MIASYRNSPIDTTSATRESLPLQVSSVDLGVLNDETKFFSDEAYFVAFSLLILQTDAFNKSNKRKMQKQEYIKNTHEYGEGISEDVLACFFDNICYTPFIHVEDDLELSAGRMQTRKGRRSKFPLTGAEVQKKTLKEPIDPYTLIIDGRLDWLRPNLKDVMNGDDPYGYLGTGKSLDLPDLRPTFFPWGVLQIVSARSRPDAFNSPMTMTNPEDAHPGLVDINVTKVGVLWRKDVKKKKTRSPWQEWGAILTGSQLYFFKSVTWIKGLLHQYEQHQKSSRPGSPVIFKPPMENFKPHALVSMNDAVALQDASYKKHKNAFILVRHGGVEETLLAESEGEMNEWLAKLNYAAAFRTAGVRMRAMVGHHPDKAGETGRTETSNANGTSANGGPPPGDDDADGPLTEQILLARRQIIRRKIQEANDKLLAAQKQLEHQLRNSRHLQLLAPIQAKTREQVILAAGRMAAKLKWIRMEIWRVKCHRDILWMDLKDEGVLEVGFDTAENIGLIPCIVLDDTSFRRKVVDSNEACLLEHLGFPLIRVEHPLSELGAAGGAVLLSYGRAGMAGHTLVIVGVVMVVDHQLPRCFPILSRFATEARWTRRCFLHWLPGCPRGNTFKPLRMVTCGLAIIGLAAEIFGR